MRRSVSGALSPAPGDGGVTDHGEANARTNVAGVDYLDATVITGEPAPPSASALWVRDGRVAGVGSGDELARAAGPRAAQVRLAGATVVPGFIDAHCHVVYLGYLRSGADCSQPGAPDVPSVQQRLATTPVAADGWVTGSGYAEYKLAERRHPTRWDLDQAVPGAPCVLYQTSLHACVVNSAGLAALGLSDASPDPVRGRLGRGPDGRLDGRLVEGPMFELSAANLRRSVRSGGASGSADLAERGGRHLASLGITSCSDAATDAPTFLALRAAERAGSLPIRVTAMFDAAAARWPREAGMTTGFGSDRLRVGAVKLFADGGMSSRTAAVDEAYLDPPGEMGLLLADEAELLRAVRRFDSAGFQVGVHAQGERGIRAALGALRHVTAGGNPMRHRIEHGGAFRPELRDLAARQGVHVVTQPGFLSSLGDGFLEAFGPDRADHLYPIRSLLEAGVLVAGSSDAPVIDASPLLGMRDAILRRTEAGEAIGPKEAIGIEEALALYTASAAFVGWSEERVGSLAVGRLADFVVLDANPLAVPPERLPDLIVRATVVGGEVVAGSLPNADEAGPTWRSVRGSP